MRLQSVQQARGEPVRRGATVTIAQWERAVLLRHGQIERVLEPGLHRFWQQGCTVRRVDSRPWVLSLPVQEVPTADGATVKVTVAGQAKVTDPVGYMTAAQNPEQALYLAVQVALRDVIATVTIDDLLTGRGSVSDRLTAGISGLDELGLAVERLVLKDVMLGGELKRAYAEVLVARAHGLAALERARGETAALRSLANAARMAADNPALLQLRLLQQLEASAGHTVVIGAPTFGAGLPRSQADGPPA